MSVEGEYAQGEEHWRPRHLRQVRHLTLPGVPLYRSNCPLTLFALTSASPACPNLNTNPLAHEQLVRQSELSFAGSQTAPTVALPHF